MTNDLQFVQTENVITLTKQYNVPQETLFDAFKDPNKLEKWWGPETWPATIISYDFNEGGQWRYYMTSPEGEKAYGLATIESIDEPNSISYLDAFSDEAGNINTELPQGHMTFRFVEENGMTTLTMTGRYDTAEQADELIKMGMIDGMKDTWNQLEQLVS